MLILVIVLAILGLFVYAYYFIPKAQVTIYLEPKTISQDITFTVDPNASSSAGSLKVIPAAKESYEATQSQDSPTTGTITVGDKASGKVAIYNRTLSTKTLGKGTVIQAENLKFTLNEEVKVASASTKENADFSITLEPAKAESAITAAQIGSQYNLPANTKFTVANFGSDSVIGSATSDITGGSSQEVAAVSKTDQSTLQASLEADLAQKIVTDLAAKSSLETKVVSIGKPTVKTAEFSAKVGEPASTLSLTLTMAQAYYTFKLADILQLANQADLQIPTGLILVPHLTNVQIKDTTTAPDGTVSVTATIAFIYLPQVDDSQVLNHLRGRPPSLTQKYLHTLPGFVVNRSQIKPALPFQLNSYPIPVQNFELIIKAKE